MFLYISCAQRLSFFFGCIRYHDRDIPGQLIVTDNTEAGAAPWHLDHNGQPDFEWLLEKLNLTGGFVLGKGKDAPLHRPDALTNGKEEGGVVRVLTYLPPIVLATFVMMETPSLGALRWWLSHTQTVCCKITPEIAKTTQIIIAGARGTGKSTIARRLTEFYEIDDEPYECDHAFYQAFENPTKRMSRESAIVRLNKAANDMVLPEGNPLIITCDTPTVARGITRVNRTYREILLTSEFAVVIYEFTVRLTAALVRAIHLDDFPGMTVEVGADGLDSLSSLYSHVLNRGGSAEASVGVVVAMNLVAQRPSGMEDEIGDGAWNCHSGIPVSLTSF